MTPEAGVGVARAAGLPASELILGGQRSGKSRQAEMRAAAWLAADARHRVVVIATAQAWDDGDGDGDGEMRRRIDRHRADRAQRLPRAVTVEEPLRLAEAVATHAAAGDTLVLVDCLTLWLSNLRSSEARNTQQNTQQNRPLAQEDAAQAAMLSIAIEQAAGPVVLVSNEIGLGVVPMGREVRAFVDALGRLNQRIAAVCPRVSLMAAGLPLVLKEPM